MKFNPGVSYLKENDWGSISIYLEPLVGELTKVSKEFSLNVECGKRWPTIELSRNIGGKIDLFKLSLNSNYLDDERVFFEFIYNQFSKKIFGGGSVEKTEILSSYSPQDMENSELVLEDIKNKLMNYLL